MSVTDFRARRMAPKAAAPDGGARQHWSTSKCYGRPPRGEPQFGAQPENRNDRGDYPDPLLAMTDQPATPRTPSEDATRPAEAVSQSKATIGPYRVLQCIGEGGMGQAWRAEQISPVRRQVALKLLKAGMDTAHVIARFEAERQALAVMDHPAIAKVFDAGATPEGVGGRCAAISTGSR
jgi:serine/threonine protein kinase